MFANSIRLEGLFDKYVQGNISQEEFAEFWHLVRESQADNTLSEKLTAFWQQEKGDKQLPGFSDKSKVFNRILEKGKERKISFRKLRIRSIGQRTYIAAAAAILVILLASAYFFYPRQSRTAWHPQSSLASAGRTLYTQYVLLPDGSSVILHAGSTLDYPASFGGNYREVTLHGQAYFDVRQDSKKPFIIHTGNVRTTVLGTAFNINSDSNKITVSVTGGKVKVEDGQKLLAELTPNQQIIYNVPEATAKKNTVNADQLVTDWTKQDMVFDGDSFDDIATLLSRRYGVSIRFNNPDLGKCLIVASFSGTETLQNVLETLCTIQNASYTIADSKQILIDGKGCH